MSKLVSINRGKILGTYMDAQNVEPVAEGTYFYTGVLLSVVLPQYILYVYGGLLPLMAFVISGLIGLTAGVAKYYWFPYQPLSCVAREAEARIPPREHIFRKKAA